MRSKVSSYTPIKGGIKDLKHFSENLHLSEVNTTQELFSKCNMKVIGKLKLESSPEIKLGKAVFSGSKSEFLKNQRNRLKQNLKENNHIMDTLQKNIKSAWKKLIGFMEVISFLKVKNRNCNGKTTKDCIEHI